LIGLPLGLPTDQEAAVKKERTVAPYVLKEDEGAVNEKSVASQGMSQAGPTGSRDREEDAIYQEGKPVARVVEPDVDTEAKEIRFEEIVDSDHLVLAEECEFQKYRIMVQKIAFATRVDQRPGRKGRTLAGCTAEILGYIEQ
jgi:hypothetical protein